jgi:hypothetical protein
MREYRDIGVLSRIAVIAVSISLVTELAYGLLSLQLFRSLDTGIDLRLARVADIAAVVNLVALFACIIVVGRWIYRASVNAHAVSSEMTISPGWAVGWYFVPIANLFKPYQAMREIWMASHFRGNWHDEPTPQLLVGWWALWIVTNILGNISFRLSMRDDSADMFAMTSMIDVVQSVLNVPLCLILIAIMRRIAAAQARAPYEETFA